MHMRMFPKLWLILKGCGFMLVLLTIIRADRGFCGGGQQQPPPQVSANFFCEWDQMGASDQPYFGYIFAPELKLANPHRIVTYWADSTNLETKEW